MGEGVICVCVRGHYFDRFKKVITVLLVVSVVLGGIPFSDSPAFAATFLENYTLSGNAVDDMLRVAEAQVGRYSHRGKSQ